MTRSKPLRNRPGMSTHRSFHRDDRTHCNGHHGAGRRWITWMGIINAELHNRAGLHNHDSSQIRSFSCNYQILPFNRSIFVAEGMPNVHGFGWIFHGILKSRTFFTIACHCGDQVRPRWQLQYVQCRHSCTTIKSHIHRTVPVARCASRAAPTSTANRYHLDPKSYDNQSVLASHSHIFKESYAQYLTRKATRRRVKNLCRPAVRPIKDASRPCTTPTNASSRRPSSPSGA